MNQDIGTDYRSILQLALPISAGTFVQFLVVLTDNLFLSRTSDVALNGAGNAGIFYITLGMVGAGFANTGQILIARRMGKESKISCRNPGAYSRPHTSKKFKIIKI